MFVQITALLLILSIAVPFGIYFISGRKHGKGMLVTNITTFFGVLLTATCCLFGGNVGLAEGEAAAAAASGDIGMAYLAAALVTGMATIGAGIAVASASSAALGAISEDPKIMGKSLIFVALAEGIALYGLLVTFMILGRLG